MPTKIRYIRLILLLLIAGCCQELLAQAPTDEQLLEENYNLQREVKAKERELAPLIKDLEKAKTELADAQAKLKTARETGKAAALRAEIAKLQHECDSLQGAAAAASLAASKEEAARKARQQHEIDSLRAVCEADSATMVTLQNQVSAILKFQDEWLNQIVDYVKTQRDKSYAELDANEIAAKLKEYESFNGIDDNKHTVAKACSALKALHKECSAYSEAKKAVEGAYNSQSVDGALSTVADVLPQVSNAGRKQELSTLASLLQGYRPTVEKLQQLLKEVDTKTAKIGGITGAATDVVKDMVKQCVSANPDAVANVGNYSWLKAQYGAYYNSLSKKAHDAILNLNK